MSTPLSNKPQINQKNILEGYIIRYFAQAISTKRITEIDKKQYDILNKNPYYKVIQLQWIITGFANDNISSNGNIIYGTRHQNQITTDWYNTKLPGLNRILNNPLEYFTGIYNQ